jgi:starvation-inducible DNA-binding protein
VTTKVRKLEPRKAPARLDTPTDLSTNAVRDVSTALNGLLADTFALYVKTKNFHWHVSGPHFRDYHLLLDEQADGIEKSIDILAERVRKVGGTTIRSIGHLARLQRVEDNDKDYVSALDMLRELMDDNKAQIEHMREAHKLADEHEDVATASLLEVFIDEAEKRCWFLFEASREAERSGHYPEASMPAAARPQRGFLIDFVEEFGRSDRGA